jgi:hypothetical protein
MSLELPTTVGFAHSLAIMILILNVKCCKKRAIVCRWFHILQSFFADSEISFRGQAKAYITTGAKMSPTSGFELCPIGCS